MADRFQSGAPPELEALRLLKTTDPAEFDAILSLYGQIEKLEVLAKAKTDFMSFVKAVWPSFILGRHHYEMAKIIEGIIAGDSKRSIINMPPRFSKSEFFSYLLPAYYLGKFPTRKVIQTCATLDLAVGFSRKVRNLVATEEYQRIFPGTVLRADSKAAGRWHTGKGGEYFAVGAEGNVTGKGGDLAIIDDPTGEQEAITALTDPSTYNRVYDWYVAGIRQRLQPGGTIVVVQSRWATNDLTGRLIKAQSEADSPIADKWNVVELPAILPSGASLWPEFWPIEQLQSTRLALPAHRWAAQYMQQPSSETTAIIKRDWWKRWRGHNPPECTIKMVTLDTAYSAKESADFTACTTWGVFQGTNEKGKDASNIILLDAWKERMEFPALKAAAHKYYLKWQPDIFIVEAKAAGAPLIYELRARGIPVSEYTPSRGTKAAPNDKLHRTHSITDIFASGFVWAPEQRWADDVIEECAGFPQLPNDDWVDCTVMAMMRFRQGGFIQLSTDSWDSEPMPQRKRAAYY